MSCVCARDTSYASAFDDARQCNPDAAVDECTQRASRTGSPARRGAFVNLANTDALARAADAADTHEKQNCRAGIVCGACLDPIAGQCSSAGACENVYPGAGRSCKVGDKIYADGERRHPLIQ